MRVFHKKVNGRAISQLYATVREISRGFFIFIALQSPYRRQKKIGSNPLLRDKKVCLNSRGAWKILANFTAERHRREAANKTHTTLLGLLDKLRTYFEENPE